LLRITLFAGCPGEGKAKVSPSRLINRLHLSQLHKSEKQKGCPHPCQSANDLKHHFNR